MLFWLYILWRKKINGWGIKNTHTHIAKHTHEKAYQHQYKKQIKPITCKTNSNITTNKIWKRINCQHTNNIKNNKIKR